MRIGWVALGFAVGASAGTFGAVYLFHAGFRAALFRAGIDSTEEARRLAAQGDVTRAFGEQWCGVRLLTRYRERAARDAPSFGNVVSLALMDRVLDDAEWERKLTRMSGVDRAVAARLLERLGDERGAAAEWATASSELDGRPVATLREMVDGILDRAAASEPRPGG